MTDLKQTVLSKITEKDVVTLAKQLISVPSVNPPGKLEEISSFLSCQLRDMGFKVKTVSKEAGKPNVIATTKGTGPALLFQGHMDTAPVTETERSSWTVYPFAGVVQDGKIYGRGAVDMKGGIAAILTAAKAILEADAELQRDLMLAFYVDEEAGMMEAGSMFVVSSGHLDRVTSAMMPEPSNMQVRYVFKGRTIYEIAVTGKTAHTSSPEIGTNAIVKMARVIGALEDLRLKFEPHKWLGSCTVSATGIEGGMPGTNPSVPDFCRALVEVRMVPGQTVDGVKREIENAIEELRAQDHDLNTVVKVLHRRGASETSRESEIFQVLWASAKDVLGKDPELFTGGGAASDLHWLLEKGVPCVEIGPGPRNMAHKPNEFAEIRNLVELSKIYALVALKICCPETR